MTFAADRANRANPLFRGFDRTTEDTEGYHEPVLIRLNTKDATELAGGFPKTADALFKYHAVILDDLEAEFFTRDQMSLLQKFVSERGGGFLMLGGAESFHQGKYEHTPVGEMLPVYLDYVDEAKPVANLRLNLTPHGWLEPWARLRDNEAAERTRLTEMPALQVLNRVRGTKPGASVIAEAQDESGGKYPALVAQRFGNGRVGALLLGDLWRWGLRDEATRSDQDKAWRQMIRWLIADVPERISFLAETKREDPDQAMSLQVRARDKEFKPLDNATVKITVTPMTRCGCYERIDSGPPPYVGGYKSHSPQRRAGTHRSWALRNDVCPACDRRLSRRSRGDRCRWRGGWPGASRLDGGSGGGRIQIAQTQSRVAGKPRAPDRRRSDFREQPRCVRGEAAEPECADHGECDHATLASAVGVSAGADLLRRGVGPATMERNGVRGMDRPSNVNIGFPTPKSAPDTSAVRCWMLVVGCFGFHLANAVARRRD